MPPLSKALTRGNFARNGLDSGHFHHQIGQPFGGIQPAHLAGGGSHRGQLGGFGGESGDFRRQPGGREFGLRNP
jgi:hypothetical protein